MSMKNMNLLVPVEQVNCTNRTSGLMQFSAMGFYFTTLVIKSLKSWFLKHSFKTFCSSPRNQEQKNAVFRFIRFSLQKEQEANDSFNRLSKVLDELDIPVLYSSGVLQSVLQSARKEPEWSRNHGVHFFFERKIYL